MLKQILLDSNAHYILAGKVHQGDHDMYQQLLTILKLVDSDPALRERVHYIQDYDETLGRALAIGSDVAINVPIIGLEACGTSWEKDIANLKLLACLEVSGVSSEDETTSLYANLRRAAQIIASDELLTQHIHRQLIAYLPIISGARMLKDYLKFLFPARHTTK